MRKAINFMVLGAALPVAFAAVAVEITVEPGGSIQKAINAAKAGDTVVIRGGTYREAIRISKAYEGAPLTVRAAKGERVVLSGFETITGWTDLGGGLYSAKTSGGVGNLFVGLRPQQCGRCRRRTSRAATCSARACARFPRCRTTWRRQCPIRTMSSSPRSDTEGALGPENE